MADAAPDPSSSAPGARQRNDGPQHRGGFVELTPEERAVLIECRRNSLARGIPLAVGSMLVLRWFVKQGRVPLHIQRWSGLYYSLTFITGLFFGVKSYQQACFDKIMALENSRLADQVRARRGMGLWDQEDHGSSESRGTRTDTGPSPSQHRRPMRPLRPPSSPPPERKLPVGDSHGGYSATGTVSSVEEYTGSAPVTAVDQPSAFGSSASLPSSQGGWAGGGGGMADDHAAGKQTRGRTFNEIREESRRRQLQQNFPRASAGGREGGSAPVEQDWRQRRQTGQGSSGKPVRRNKYGDPIDEDEN